MAPPTVLHLLGRWKDAQMIFPVPARPDLWRRPVTDQESKPYLVVHRLELCKEADHRHFVTADSAIFPGQEMQLLDPDNRPQQPENYNWTPATREGDLLNWDLDEEDLELEEELEDPGFVADPRGGRHIRQAPPSTVESLPPNDEVEISLLLRSGLKKVELANVYNNFLNAFVQNLANKQMPVVRDHYQNIWSTEASWNVELVPFAVASSSSSAATEQKYKVRFTVPAHGILSFSDVSVMQALGFDSVGQTFKQDPFGIRSSSKSDNSKSYFWNNNSYRAKVYESTRPVYNLPIYKLRSAAKNVRKKMPPELLATSPDILNELENLQTNFVLQFDYPKSTNALKIKSTLAVYNLDPEKKLKAYSDFFQDLFNQLALKHHLDVEAFTVAPLEQNFVQFSYTKPMSLNLDRFSIKMLFGRNTWKQLEFFEEPHLEWNLGRQSTKHYKMLLTPEEIEVRRKTAVQEVSVESVDPLAGVDPQTLEERQEAVTEVDPLAGVEGGAAGLEEKIAKTSEIDPAKKEGVAEAEETQPTVVSVEPEQTPPAVPTLTTGGEGSTGGGGRGGVVEIEKSKTAGGVETTEGATGGEAEETLPPTVVVEIEKSKTAVSGGVEETLPPTVEELPSQAELDKIKKAKELAERVEAAKKKADAAAETAKLDAERKKKRADDEAKRQADAKAAADLFEQQQREDRERLQRIQDYQRQMEAEQAAQAEQEAEEERQRQLLERLQQLAEEEAEEEAVVVVNVDPGAAGGGGGDAPAQDVYVGEAATGEPVRRDRWRYLVGNTRRKRRMPVQQAPELALTENLILILENCEKQNDFIYEWGRCCIAANIEGGKVVSKTKVFLDIRNQQDLIFNLLDSQHLCLMRSPETTLAKIEIYVYV